jgi:beta-glucosidase
MMKKNKSPRANRGLPFLLCCALAPAAPWAAAPPATPEAIDARVQSIVQRLTQEEKLALLSGTGFDTPAVPRLGLPGLHMTDGPAGVRDEGATAWPVGIALAASFDPELAGEVAAAMARETKSYGRNVLLGPCVNIERVPQGGRNFEAFGEDPLLASRLAVAWVRGLQGEGVAATVKHFAANNQETERMSIDARVSERALQEIYFPHFRAAIEEGDAQAVMCAYNRLNGPFACESPALLRDVLRRDWGFRGLVMSDWDATHSTAALAAGLDLEMPSGVHLGAGPVAAALASGALRQDQVDAAVSHQVRVQVAMGWLDAPPGKGARGTPAHRALNRRAAAESMVLLRNDGKLLPLSPSRLHRIAVIGPNATIARTGGGGSSEVESPHPVSPLAGLRAALPGAEFRVAEGAPTQGFPLPVVPPSALRPPPGSPAKEGLRAQYFRNPKFEGEVAIDRTEGNIDNHWPAQGPAGLGQGENFSARWTGSILAPESGVYEIGITSDDGSWVWIDGRPVIDNGGEHAARTRTVTLDLRAGEPREIRVDFEQKSEAAVAVLGWRRVGTNLLADAVAAARGADVALVFIGDNPAIEGEGEDRANLDLPAGQEELVAAVLQVNPRTIVVLQTGVPVLLGKALERAPALLQAWFPGSEVGHAIADVLLGIAEPGGRLPMSWPRRWSDATAYGAWPGAQGHVDYSEGIYVGYRGLDTHGVEPRFAFGYGLGYSSVAWGNLQVAALPGAPRRVAVEFTLANEGTRATQEVAEVYVHPLAPAIDRPVQELKAFRRVALAPGARQTVRIELAEDAFRYFDPASHRWVFDPGRYEIRLGRSSRDEPLRATVELR